MSVDTKIFSFGPEVDLVVTVFSGVEKPRNDHGVYGFRKAEFVVPLVKAMQEQQGIVEQQRRQLEQFEAKNELLIKRIEKLDSFVRVNN